MAENTIPLRNVKLDTSEAIDRVKREVDELVDSLDFGQMTRSLQEFSREKPIAFGLAALTVGFAAGMLMRKSIQSIEEGAQSTQSASFDQTL